MLFPPEKSTFTQQIYPTLPSRPFPNEDYVPLIPRSWTHFRQPPPSFLVPPRLAPNTPSHWCLYPPSVYLRVYRFPILPTLPYRSPLVGPLSNKVLVVADNADGLQLFGHLLHLIRPDYPSTPLHASCIIITPYDPRKSVIPR